MMAKTDQQTAKIYAFPVKKRIVAERLRKLERDAARLRPVNYAATEFGSGWYHEAAIQGETKG